MAFEFNQAFDLLLVLHSFLFLSPLQHIILSLMIRYHCPHLVGELFVKFQVCPKELIEVALLILSLFANSAANSRVGLFRVI
jgi:hypothetical protein